MLVDDDPQLMHWLAGLLEQSGWEIVAADDGNVAITRYESHHPDVVVIDQYMPGLDGLDVARHIRSIDPDATLLMFSASTDRKVLDAAEALDMHFVSKIDLDALLRMLEELHAKYVGDVDPLRAWWT